MVLKLYGSAISTCVQRVLFTARELGLEIELSNVDLLKGEHKKPEFLKLQPFGQIPVLDDNGFIVYESRAIAQYLADKSGEKGEKIFPKDLKKRAIIQQQISVEVSNFNGAVQPLVSEAMFKKMMHGQEPDPEKVKEHRAKVEAVLEVYEKILADRPFVAGQDFSIADIFHAPYGNYAVVSGNGDLFDNPKRPNVSKWWKTITSRPAWTATAPKF